MTTKQQDIAEEIDSLGASYRAAEGGQEPTNNSSYLAQASASDAAACAKPGTKGQAL